MKARQSAIKIYCFTIWIILIIIRDSNRTSNSSKSSNSLLSACMFCIWSEKGGKSTKTSEGLYYCPLFSYQQRTIRNVFYPNVNRLQRGFLKLISPTPWYLSLQKLILVYLPETNYNVLSWTKKYFAFQCSIKDFQKMPESFTCTVFFLAKVQRNELWDGHLSQMTSSGTAIFNHLWLYCLPVEGLCCDFHAIKS